MTDKDTNKKATSILQGKIIMPPPWLAAPSIERYSIGWRMGAGEYYLCRFRDWLESLNSEERTSYQDLFPEPIFWSGWWADEDSDEDDEDYDDASADYMQHDQYLIETWQAHGQAKYSRAWLQQAITQGHHAELLLFWGHQNTKDEHLTQSCLSQWWQQDFCVSAEKFFCAEQWMMANKAELFGDENIKQQILHCQDPRSIKSLGRKVANFDQTVWDKFKFSIVLKGNYFKFIQNPKLRDFLISTKDSVLVEASPYDAVWGIKLSKNSPQAQDPCKWQGQNLLGFAIMEVRDEIKRVTQNAHLCDWTKV